MCFDAKTSAITFTIGLLSSIYLFNNGKKTDDKSNKLYSLIVLLISLMQLIEYFLWKNQNCNIINHVFSLLILVLLPLQPILTSYYSYYLYSEKTHISYNLLVVYSIIFSIYSAYLINWLNKTKLCSTPKNGSCRLHWAPFTKLSKHKPYFMFWGILYFSGCLYVAYDVLSWNNKELKKYLMRYLFLPISFILTFLYILIKKNSIFKFTKTPINTSFEYADIFGSLWCFSAIFLGITCILETIL